MTLPATRPTPTQSQSIWPRWAMSIIAATMAISIAKAEMALALRAVLTTERRLIPTMNRTEASMYRTWIRVSMRVSPSPSAGTS